MSLPIYKEAENPVEYSCGMARKPAVLALAFALINPSANAVMKSTSPPLNRLSHSLFQHQAVVQPLASMGPSLDRTSHLEMSKWAKVQALSAPEPFNESDASRLIDEIEVTLDYRFT